MSCGRQIDKYVIARYLYRQSLSVVDHRDNEVVRIPGMRCIEECTLFFCGGGARGLPGES